MKLQEDPFTGTRLSGPRMPEALRPRMGERSMAGRNVDSGPGKRRAAIGLSPDIPEDPPRDRLRPRLARGKADSSAFCEIRRDWGIALWPHVSAGSHKPKKRILEILSTLEWK